MAALCTWRRTVQRLADTGCGMGAGRARITREAWAAWAAWAAWEAAAAAAPRLAAQAPASGWQRWVIYP